MPAVRFCCCTIVLVQLLAQLPGPCQVFVCARMRNMIACPMQLLDDAGQLAMFTAFAGLSWHAQMCFTDTFPMQAQRYGDQSYWDSRYISQTAKFEWYHDYSCLKSLILKFCSKNRAVLQVGVGLSSLQALASSNVLQNLEPC